MPVGSISYNVRSLFVLSILTLSLVTLSLLNLSCQHQPGVPSERYQYTQLHLGVQVRIVLYAEKEALAREAARRAFARIAALEDVFSDYRPTSEVRRLAASPPGIPHPVSAPLFRVLDAAQRLAAETDGAFDVSAGPLTALWREARRGGALPDAAALDAARRRVGWAAIHLDAAAGTVTLDRADMLIDLGGIAKGYILDEALAELARAGVARAMIEAGGDLVVSAPPPGAEGWAIAIHGAPSEMAARARRLSHAAVATSGDTEQYLEVDGVRYSHVVDPRTGRALTTRRMATVIAHDGMTADSYATALTVLETEEGLALAERRPGLQVFVRTAGADQAPVR